MLLSTLYIRWAFKTLGRNQKSNCNRKFFSTRTVNGEDAGGEAPPAKFFTPMEKGVAHALKLLDID